MSKSIRNLYCVLTEPELLERGKSLAERVEAYGEIEREGKAVAEDLRTKLKAARRESDDLARIVETRKEKRPVECFDRMDVRAHEVVTFRGDTGEEVERRPMTAEERQADLFTQPDAS